MNTNCDDGDFTALDNFFPLLAIIWKTKKYHNVGTFPNFNVTIISRGKIDTS